MKPLELRVFKVGNSPLVDIDIWIHCLRGDVNLVGPGLLRVEESGRLSGEQKQRFSVKPGIITPFDVRRKSGIAYLSEADVSAEFARDVSATRRMEILVTACSQWVFGRKNTVKNRPAKFSLFGVSMSNVAMNTAIDRIMLGIKNDTAQRHPTRVAFVNADCVNKYTKDSAYKNALKRFDHVFADGIGVKLAARFHGADLVANVNGTDMFPMLCEKLSNKTKKVFLYGGREGVVRRTAKKLQSEYPGLEVVGVINGYSSLTDEQICKTINESQADIVLVAMGAPLQEVWMEKNAAKLNVGVIMGVGGLFDFYSESVSRAPLWLRELSLEWVWRLAMQPRDKAHRYLIGNPLFLIRIARSAGKARYLANTLEVQA